MERPSLKARPSQLSRRSSRSKNKNLLRKHPLEKYIGKPTDSTPFNLASVPLALVGLSDPRDGSKLDEINAYMPPTEKCSTLTACITWDNATWTSR